MARAFLVASEFRTEFAVRRSRIAVGAAGLGGIAIVELLALLASISPV